MSDRIGVRIPFLPSNLIITSLLAAFAIASLQGCVSAGGNNASAQPTQDAVSLSSSQRIRAGNVLRDAGQLDEALNQFNRALEINPAAAEAYLGIGSIQHRRAQYEEAKASYRQATLLDSVSVEARYYLGLMHQVLGETGQAIENYRQALRLDPDNTQAHRDLATAYLQVGHPRLALPHAREAARLDPTDQAALLNLGAVLSLLQQYEEALDVYRVATELGDLDEPVLLGLGDTHLRLGNIERAINTLQVLVRRYPSAVSHERLGYGFFRSRSFDLAERHYRESLKYNPDQVGALNGLGACLLAEYVRKGERNRDRYKLMEALRLWRQSLRVQPGQEPIVDLLTRWDPPD
jgi:tetratricopeptide (TPR) repeat protein